MSKDDAIELEGVVIDFCKGIFRVQVDEGHIASCTLSGKIRQSGIRVILHDRVKIEVSVYDTSRGRIVYRMKASATPQ